MARGNGLSLDRPMQVRRLSYRLNSMPEPGVKRREMLSRLDRPPSRSCGKACSERSLLRPFSLKQQLSSEKSLSLAPLQNTVRLCLGPCWYLLPSLGRCGLHYEVSLRHLCPLLHSS